MAVLPLRSSGGDDPAIWSSDPSHIRGVGTPHRHPVLAVVGASGGLGASTLCVAIAARLDGAVTAVDALGRGSLDVTAGVEELDGVRWADLGEHEGSAAPEMLRAALPTLQRAGGRSRGQGRGPVPVLAGSAAAWPPSSVRVDVIGSLAERGPVVLDLPADLATSGRWSAVPQASVMVVGLRPRWLRDAEVIASRLTEGPGRTWLVTRGGVGARPVAARVAEHLRLPLIAHWVDDPAVVRAERVGVPVRRGPTARVARCVAEALAAGAVPR